MPVLTRLAATPTPCCKALNSRRIDGCGVLFICFRVEKFVDMFSENRGDGVDGIMPR